MKKKTKAGGGKRIRPAQKLSPKKKVATRGRKSAASSSPENWHLRLYVAGQTPKSLAAFANLKRLCEQHLGGRYEIEVVDLLKSPQLAQSAGIIALPTLVRKIPEPIKRVIGDLSNTERVLIAMELSTIKALATDGRGA